MRIRCIWEHNGPDTLLYAENFPGAFTRGASRDEALMKMEGEIRSYLRWRGRDIKEALEVEIIQEKASDLQICDADSDVLFASERGMISLETYQEHKMLALRSAADFMRLYAAIPDQEKSVLPARMTFYGAVPRTAREMYEHTKNVNDYYFGEIGVEADHEGTILECRARGFERLELRENYIQNRVYRGSYGEAWSLLKVMRRFVWHDRIHAKAMFRMARETFGEKSVPDVFRFTC